jgi:hypothetical protein
MFPILKLNPAAPKTRSIDLMDRFVKTEFSRCFQVLYKG